MHGFEENKYATQTGGKIAGDARKKLEIETGSRVVTHKNFLSKSDAMKREKKR